MSAAPEPRRTARERILAAAIEQIAREGIDGVRIARIATLVGGGIPTYDKNTWIDEALKKNKDEKRCELNPTYQQTHWYRFHQAAKAQLAEVVDLIKEI